MPIPAFFHDATRYIEKELNKVHEKSYDFSGAKMDDARALLKDYERNVDALRGRNVSVVIAALKIKCQEQGKEGILTKEDDREIAKNSIKDAKKILEKKPIVVLLLRHFARVLAVGNLFPMNKATQLRPFLLHEDAAKPEQNSSTILVWLIGQMINNKEMSSLEPRGIPQFIVDFITYMEQQKNTKKDELYSLSGVNVYITKVTADYEANGAKILKNHRLPAISGALRQFIKKEDVIDPTIVEAMVNIKKTANKQVRESSFRTELRKISISKLDILVYFICHLNRVSRGELNHFLAQCTCTCLGDLERTNLPDEVKKGSYWLMVVKDLIDEPDLYFW